MRAVVVTKPGQVKIADLPIPEVGPYQVRVKTEAACLCNATDGKLVTGHFPGVNDYPLVLGHESVGIVDVVGEKVRNFKMGDRVVGGLLFDFGVEGYASGWGGFCEYTLANDHDAMVEDGVANEANGWVEVYEIQRPVDADISVEDALMLCTWREVYGGIDDFHLTADDDILIFGAGPVGLSFIKFCKILGLNYVGLVDPLSHKREKALAMGADAVFAPDDPKLATITEDRGKKFDAVIDAVGNPKIINGALPLVKLGGSICVYGVVADEAFTLQKSKGPYNFNLFIHQWPTRRREKEAQSPLCNWIRKGKISAKDFITHDFPLEEVDQAMQAVKKGNVLKAVLRYY